MPAGVPQTEPTVDPERTAHVALILDGLDLHARDVSQQVPHCIEGANPRVSHCHSAFQHLMNTTDMVQTASAFAVCPPDSACAPVVLNAESDGQRR